MSFMIKGLAAEQFKPLFDLSDEALAARGVLRQRVDMKPGYPCRVTLEDADIGETVLLLNFENHKTSTPYRSAYAIYVRDNAENAADFENELPPTLIGRPIALRLFNQEGMLIGADIDVKGDLAAKIENAFSNENVAYIHAHNAMHGCFAAEITRAG